jgi:hypothetical protein
MLRTALKGRPPALALTLAGSLGITLGVATLAVLWTLYPVPRGEAWIVVGIGITSLVVVGALGVFLSRAGAEGVCETFLMGYVVGLVTVAALMMANEIVPKFRHVPL